MPRFVVVKGNPLERVIAKTSPEPTTGCWLWTGLLNKQGYGTTQAYGKKMQAHRLSWSEHNGPIPEGMCVLHKCDTPTCVNPRHLFLGTHQDNSDDKMRKGRNKTCPIIVTRSVMEEVRALLKTGAKYKEVTGIYGISPTTICKIRYGVGRYANERG